MTQNERRRALADSLQDVIDHPTRRAIDLKRDSETTRHDASRRRRLIVATLLVVAWGSLGWLWLARPDAVFNPSLGMPMGGAGTPEEGLRYGMYLQAARIREFQIEQGRRPATIVEAGEAAEGLTYVVAETGWTVRGMLNGLPMELTSRMSADSFLTASRVAGRP